MLPDAYPQAPRPLAECPAARLEAIEGVLTDIDDTLTRGGEIEPPALAALQRLASASVPVIAVTGRGAGWGEERARDWPVTAVVAENGAVMLHPQSGTMRVEFSDPPALRTRNAQRLAACAQAILAEVPGAMLARDSAGRITDIAVDHGENARLDAAGIAAVVGVMRRHGLSATVSSIHINGWIGAHSKWTGAQWAVRTCRGRMLEPSRWIYVGDSANDEVMFDRIALSVGVANIVPHLATMSAVPAWLTRGERGAGFAEVADRLLAVRRR